MDNARHGARYGATRSAAAAAEVLRQDAARTEAARRLRPGEHSTRAVDRLVELAVRLLGAGFGEVSLLDDVALVAGAAGTAAPAVGTETPLPRSPCTVTAVAGTLVVPDAPSDERLHRLPAVTSGDVRAYLGTALTTPDGHAVGALCVMDRAPREWTDADLTTLRELAASVVTELELSALLGRYEADRLRWELAVDAAEIGTFDWDLRTERLVWDGRLLEMFGYAAESADDSAFDESIAAFNARLHPADLPRVTEALQQCIDACGEFEAEYRIVLPDGEMRWVQARGRAVPGEDGTAARVLGAAYDTTADRTLEARVARVLDTMPAGFYSLDRQWRFTHLNAEAERVLGRSREELLGKAVWDAFPATSDGPFEEQFRTAMETRRPVWFEAYYPQPLNSWYELRAWPSPDGLSVYFLDVTERRRSQERAESSGQRLALLARVSDELAGTLDVHAATGRLAPLVVPALADWCIVTVVDPEGRLHDVGSWHPDPAIRELVRRYACARLDGFPLTSTAFLPLHTGEPVAVTREDVLALLPPGSARDALQAIGPESAVVLPLRGRGRTLGLLTLVFQPGSSSSPEDLATAQDVADRVGLALDNARLYGQQQQLAEGLQRSLLTQPPQPDNAEIAVRYLPAVEAARVGGDWYDAFLQPGGATMLVIGDVVGHDVAAAAAMGQLRSLLRGIATYSDAAPAEVLRGLDASMASLQMQVMATAALARFEQTPQELAAGITRMRWSNAGHLPPLIVLPDGRISEPPGWDGDLLLGVEPGTTRAEAMITLPRGATVLLYTDGLIERRDADLDAGLARLRAVLADLADRPLQKLLDELLERMVDGHPDDDVALVAVRLHPHDRAVATSSRDG